jgi:hypothetical protein
MLLLPLMISIICKSTPPANVPLSDKIGFPAKWLMENIDNNIRKIKKIIGKIREKSPVPAMCSSPAEDSARVETERASQYKRYERMFQPWGKNTS